MLFRSQALTRTRPSVLLRLMVAPVLQVRHAQALALAQAQPSVLLKLMIARYSKYATPFLLVAFRPGEIKAAEQVTTTDLRAPSCCQQGVAV